MQKELYQKRIIFNTIWKDSLLKNKFNNLPALALIKVFIISFFCFLLSTAHVKGQGSFTWNGGGGDNNWTTGANWGGTAPG